VTETFELQNIPSNINNHFGFSLNQFVRAQRVGINYRWYKAAKVTWTMEPQFNVYQSGGTGPALPFIYTRMNRTGDLTVLNVNDLLAMGAKPKKFTSNVKLSYVPNWCSPGLITQAVVAVPGSILGAINNVFMNGLRPQKGWLATPDDVQLRADTAVRQFQSQVNNQGANNNGNTPSSVPGSGAAPVTAATVAYQGHDMYIEQIRSPTVVSCKVSCTVEWVFKDPKFTVAGAADDMFVIDSSGNYVPSNPIIT
jgi:hypothetical protein